MPNYNKVILIGHLTRDPELRYTPKATAVCKIGIATTRTWYDDTKQKREETCFVDVDFFGKQAETIGQYMKKGSPMMVEGRLKLETWDDKNTGAKRSKIGVVGEGFQFLANKDRAESYRGGDGPDSDTPATERQQAREERVNRPPDYDPDVGF